MRNNIKPYCNLNNSFSYYFLEVLKLGKKRLVLQPTSNEIEIRGFLFKGKTGKKTFGEEIPDPVIF